MKTFVFFGVLAFSLMSISPVSGQNHYGYYSQNVPQSYYDLYSMKINRAYQNFLLNNYQKRMLKTELKRIRHTERNYLWDGYISRNEYRRLAKMRANFENRFYGNIQQAYYANYYYYHGNGKGYGHHYGYHKGNYGYANHGYGYGYRNKKDQSPEFRNKRSDDHEMKDQENKALPKVEKKELDRKTLDDLVMADYSKGVRK